jgi:hypothetical protein
VLKSCDCGGQATRPEDYDQPHVQHGHSKLFTVMQFLYFILIFVFVFFLIECSNFSSILTPWSRVLLEKLTGLQLVKKFPAFNGNRRFITAFKSDCHLSLS